MKRHLATLFTLGNVAAGIAAAFLFFRGTPNLPLILIIVAAVFDVMDGWAARRSPSARNTGKWLDSGADMISFGIVPGVIIHNLLPHPMLGWSLAVPYVLAMAFRLVRFSRSDEERDRWFLGLPSPAAAIAVVAAAEIARSWPEVWMVVSVTVWVIAALAISRIAYPKGTHPCLGGLPKWLLGLIWVAHGLCFAWQPGIAALSLMTVYAAMGPVLLRRNAVAVDKQ